jgi:predicted membrane protein
MTDWDKDSLKSSIERDIHERIPDRFGRRNRSSRGSSHGMIWGAIICAFGIMLLLDHMGLVSADRLWRFWPTLIVVTGAGCLSQPGKRAWGIFLIVGGLLLQLDALDVLRFHWADLWPLAIIAAGMMMIWGSLQSRRVRAASPGGDQNATNVAAIFGGIERRISARDFRGGTVSAVFGGAELDFRDADMEGDEVVLEVNAVFGGAEIRVPENWRVEVRGQTLFGGYSDKTRDAASGDINAQKRKTLILTGTTLFGGVEVKN